MAADPQGATCENCEWVHIAYNMNEAKILMVLHAVVKHPEVYRQTTGNDPDAAAFRYRELIAAYKKVI